MEIKEHKIKGIYEVILNPHFDNRGFFMRTYDINIFNNNCIAKHWVQENHSKSIQKDILRGLHFQLPPYAETKLIRCIRGAILDVFVDLRKGSSTYGQWGSVELTEENQKSLLIPKGFAHGYCTMTNTSEIIYKVDNFYSKQHELGLIWNDTDLNISWPVKRPVLSEKDKNNLTYRDFTEKYGGIKI